MAQFDDSVWDEVIRRIECAEAAIARLTEDMRSVSDRLYQPYRVKPAEEWPPADARVGGSD